VNLAENSQIDSRPNQNLNLKANLWLTDSEKKIQKSYARKRGLNLSNEIKKLKQEAKN